MKLHLVRISIKYCEFNRHSFDVLFQYIYRIWVKRIELIAKTIFCPAKILKVKGRKITNPKRNCGEVNRFHSRIQLTTKSERLAERL